MGSVAARVVIISGSVGAGHDGTANELERRLRGRGCAVTRLDMLQLLGTGFGRLVRACYAAELAHAPRTWEWVLAALRRYPWLAALLNTLVYRLAAARTRAALTPSPDLVVSVYPGAAPLLGRLRTSGELAAPVVTFLTDMSVHPLWISPGVDLYLALHEVAAAQARAAGAGSVRVAGAAVAPRFHSRRVAGERAVIRARYGIPGDRPAALISAGSWGTGDILATAADVARTGLATPVVLCGTNDRLRTALRFRGLGVALGWVDDLAPLMRSCDVVIHNAGGLTSLEALACGVPVLSYRCLPGHGRANAGALAQAGLAAWPADPPEFAAELTAVLHAPRPATPELVLADPSACLADLLGGAQPAASASAVGSPQSAASPQAVSTAQPAGDAQPVAELARAAR